VLQCSPNAGAQQFTRACLQTGGTCPCSWGRSVGGRWLAHQRAGLPSLLFRQRLRSTNQSQHTRPQPAGLPTALFVSFQSLPVGCCTLHCAKSAGTGPPQAAAAMRRRRRERRGGCACQHRRQLRNLGKAVSSKGGRGAKWAGFATPRLEASAGKELPPAGRRGINDRDRCFISRLR